MFRNTLRKAIASVSTVALLLSAVIVPGMGVSTAQAQAQDMWYTPYLDVAQSLDMSVDYAIANPGAKMTRGELAKLYTETYDASFGITEEEVIAAMDANPFTDTTGDYKVAAALMNYLGLMYGQGGTEGSPSDTFGTDDVLNKYEQAMVAFRYDTVILGNDVLTQSSNKVDSLDSTLLAAATVTVTTLSGATVTINIPSGHWAAGAVTHLYKKGVFVGKGGTLESPSGDFGGEEDVNQVTGLAMAFRVAKFTNAKGEDTGKALPTVGIATIVSYADGTDGTTEPPVTGGGDLVATLGDQSMIPQKIVGGEATAIIGVFDIKGTGTLKSIDIKRKGISNQNTLSNVYLYEGINRLTDGGSFNSKSGLSFNNIERQIDGSMTLLVRADVAATTPVGQSVSITLVSVNGEAANLEGKMVSTASGSTLANISISGVNTVAAATVNSGTDNYTSWRQAVQVNVRELVLKALNIRVTGSAQNTALDRVTLFVDGERVGEYAVLRSISGSNYFTFDLTGAPYALSTGTHTLEVRVFVKLGASFTYTLSLQQSSDIMVTDPEVGVDVNICGNTACTLAFTASTAGTQTIGTETVVITVDPEFSNKTTMTSGTNSVGARFKVNGYGGDTKLTSLLVNIALVNACTVGVTYGTAPCNVTLAGATHTQYATGNGVQNVTLYYKQKSGGTWEQVGTQLGGAGPFNFNLGSQLIVLGGEVGFLEVRLDTVTNPAGGGAADPLGPASSLYTAGTLNVSLGVGTAEGLSSKATIATPAASGTALQVAVGSLTTGISSGMGNVSKDPNKAGITIADYTVQNNSTTESIKINNFVVTLAGTAPVTNFSNIDITGNIGSPVNGAATISFTVDIIIPPGGSKRILVTADSGSSLGNVVTTLAVGALGATSNTAINTAAVTGQTITFTIGLISSTPTVATSVETQAQYITPGETTKTAYTFVSTGGASTINELKVTVGGTAVNPIISAQIGDNIAPVLNGVAWFTGLGLDIPNGGSRTVEVSVNFTSVGPNGLVPGSTANLTLIYVKSSGGGITTIVNAATPATATATSNTAGTVATVVTSGAAYFGAPAVVVSGGTCTTLPTATATVSNGVVVSITLTGAVGCTGAPVLTVAAPPVAGTPITSATWTLVDSKPIIAVNQGVETGLVIGGAQNKIIDVTISGGENGIKLNDFAFNLASSAFTVNPTYKSARIAINGVTVAGSSCGQGVAAAALQLVFCEFGTPGDTFATGTTIVNTESNTDYDGLYIGPHQTIVLQLYVTVGGANTSTAYSTVSTSISAFNWDVTSTNGASGVNLTHALIINRPTTSHTVSQ